VKIFTALIGFFFVISVVNAQNVEFKRSNFKGKKGFSKAYSEFLDGKDAYEENVYYEAINHLEKAYDFNPNNAELNYMLGDCYLHTIYKAKALKYLKKAVELDPEIKDDIYYKLAEAYHYNYKFNEAKKEYYHFKISLDPEKLYVWDSIIKKKMDECDVGLMLMANPTNGMVVNLKTVNSEYSDYAPIVTGDGKIMYFTSRRKGSTGGKMDYYDMQYYEDVYYSIKKNYRWGDPINVGPPINTKNHDATVGISTDGQILFIYRGQANGGDIYYSIMKDSSWSVPKPLPAPINTQYHENSASIAYDNRTLYFISNRPGGIGGKDIYMSVMQDDSTWSEPVNLGPTINTPYDEDGVFIHPDNRTLYFSSKGHKTMGGYDIFFSVRGKDGKWSEPQNLGYPINTPDDDVFFVTTASGEQGFYTSVRVDGTGMKDIFVINYPSTENDEQTSKLTFLHGQVMDEDSIKHNVDIYLYDLESNKKLGAYFSNGKTGYYAMSLPAGHLYGVVFADTGYFMPQVLEIDNRNNYKYSEQNTNVILSTEKTEYSIHTTNGELAVESLPVVKALVVFLKNNSSNTYILEGPKSKIEAIEKYFTEKQVPNIKYNEAVGAKVVLKLKK
jgi:hypothetical protein